MFGLKTFQHCYFKKVQHAALVIQKYFRKHRAVAENAAAAATATNNSNNSRNTDDSSNDGEGKMNEAKGQINVAQVEIWFLMHLNL